jgi:ubiquitin thioesterase OTU1
VFNIQTCRCDTFGGTDGYKQQCFVLYDGLHYDALSVEACPGAPESADVTMFDVDDVALAQVGQP